MTMHVTREKRNRFTVRSLMCVDGVGPECAREVALMCSRATHQVASSIATVRSNIEVKLMLGVGAVRRATPPGRLTPLGSFPRGRDGAARHGISACECRTCRHTLTPSSPSKSPTAIQGVLPMCR